MTYPYTAVTDLLVAMAAWWCGRTMMQMRRNEGRWGALGNFLILLAALLGVVSFGFLPAAEPLHHGLTRIAQVLGMPFIALAFWSVQKKWSTAQLRKQIPAIGMCALGSASLGSMAWPDAWNLPGALAAFALLAVGLRSWKSNMAGACYLLAAVFLLLGSGLAIGPVSDLQVGPLRALDIFHIALASVHILFGWAARSLWRSASPNQR